MSTSPALVRARALTLTLLVVVAASCRTAEPSSASAHTQQFLVAALDTMDASFQSLEAAIAGPVDTAHAIALFRDSRRVFKRVEGLLTYYIPVSTAEINGPRMEPDDDDPSPPIKSAPIGYQVLEGALFDGSVPMDSARAELRTMRRILAALRSVAASNEMLPAAILDASRLQLARVTTLGLAGIDADPSGDAIVEAAHALEGIRDILASVIQRPATRATMDSALGVAMAGLREHPRFADFNRLHFIVGSAVPIGHLLTGLQQELGAPEPGVRRFWREATGSPFEAGAFTTTAFPPAHARPSSPALEAIGQRLFFDASLSGPRTRSCASCHQPARAFTDGRARAEAIDGTHAVSLRNTPTLLNVGMQPAFFADDRALSLENQVGVVLASPVEMGSSADTAAARVQRDASYRAAFARAMPDRGDSAITGLAVRQALAAYLRTLNAMDSRFDRAVRGDTMAMTEAERRGLTVFLGRAKCGTCHFMPLFNGVTPPFYRISEAEIIGVPATADLERPTLDPDVGRSNVEDNVINRFAFKVTSLRNVALTAPYMHNGVFRTLDDVVEFYDRGGGVGIGLALPYQSLPSTPLRLTPQEKKDLVAFMGTLTDTVTRR